MIQGTRSKREMKVTRQLLYHREARKSLKFELQLGRMPKVSRPSNSTRQEIRWSYPRYRLFRFQKWTPEAVLPSNKMSRQSRILGPLMMWMKRYPF